MLVFRRTFYLDRLIVGHRHSLAYIARPFFFSFVCGCGKKGSSKHSIAQLFWQFLKIILSGFWLSTKACWLVSLRSIEPIGSPTILFFTPEVLRARTPISRPLCAAQDNPQNLSTARTTVLSYVFFFPHTQKEKKAVWLAQAVPG